MSGIRERARKILESSTDQEINEDAVDRMVEAMENYGHALAKKSSNMAQSIKKKSIESKDIEAAERAKTRPPQK